MKEIKKIEEINVKRTDDISISFNKCINLLLNYKKLRKSGSFIIDWISNLANWQLNQIDCDEINFKIEPSNASILGFNKDNTIVISANLFKLKQLKDFVQLTDMILHEFSHIETEKLNCKIRKNEYGEADGHYKPKYSYYGVLALLKKFIDIETAGDLALAYYSKNENEQTANIQAKERILLLASTAKQIADYGWLDKMIALENELYRENNKKISQYNYKLTLHDQPLKTNLTNFQLSFASEPDGKKDNAEKNKILFYIARTLNPCYEADQILFEYYLAKKDVENCLKLINMPDFTNNKFNIKDLIALMKEKHISLSRITNIDLSNILSTQQENNYQTTVYNDDIKLSL